MHIPPLRIAILECDTPLPRTAAKHTSYGGVFQSLLLSAFSALQQQSPSPSSSPLPLPPSLALTNHDVVTAQSYPDLDSIDAILITGSRYNSFDDTPWILQLVAFTRRVLTLQRRVRVVGVCFGHQIVGRALGVPVGRSLGGWEVSVTAIDLTKKGQEIFGRPALALHQMHRDAVFSYPAGVEELAYTATCAVQGMYIAKRLITVQGHPEFNEEIVRELLEARHAVGVFDDATFEDAMARVDKLQDGQVVAEAFLRFLME